jgi:uncharacterized protein
MSQYPSQSQPYEIEYGTDEGVTFSFFNTVYAWMCVGLAVTAMVAWFVSWNTAILETLYSKGSIIMILLGAWGLSIFIQSIAHRISPMVATGLFLIYASMIGAVLSFIFIVYEPGLIAAAFVITAGTFGAMSVYGFVTNRDLSGIGSVLIMGAIGLFLASLVNVMLLGSVQFSWFITYGVLAVFIGITAWETQRLKQMAHATAGNPTMAARMAIVGSLVLYISFINMFVAILRILGSRK